MKPTRFIITTPEGMSVAGVVHGSGGVVTHAQDVHRLRADARKAAQGKRLSIYEPKPGHARVFTDYSFKESGPYVDISLIGATIEVAK